MNEPFDPAVLKEMTAKNPSIEELLEKLDLHADIEDEVPF